MGYNDSWGILSFTLIPHKYRYIKYNFNNDNDNNNAAGWDISMRTSDYHLVNNDVLSIQYGNEYFTVICK